MDALALPPETETGREITVMIDGLFVRGTYIGAEHTRGTLLVGALTLDVAKISGWGFGVLATGDNTLYT